ncbi:MAG: Sir2 family NAD-dependent protein deacetylase [Acidimicrobiia bacterium]|nr:Sir2 family NAD-dependent protein deacetylase [Acidimicrobiia bacterium]
MNDVAAAARVLADRRQILVYTGAGISTESGIPDFRGPSGIWKTADPADYTLQRYLADAEFRREAWDRRFTSSVLREARPNRAHDAVTRLWKSGRVIGVVTQNIDGLHEASGLARDSIAELHGNAHGVMCTGCDARPGQDTVFERWNAGDLDPHCLDCGAVLKSTTVYFGEMLPESEFARASLWAAMADAVIAIGTTLGVYPAAYIPQEVVSRGEPFVLVNRGETEMDREATVRLDGTAGDLMPDLVTALVG